jgi:hypothetical protein
MGRPLKAERPKIPVCADGKVERAENTASEGRMGREKRIGN